MRTWDEVVGSSPAWTAASALSAAVDELVAEHGPHPLLDRSRYVASAATAQLQAIEPELAVAASLTSLAGDIERLTTNLRDHLAPPEGTEGPPVGEVEASADNLSTTLAHLPGRPASSGELTATIEALKQQVAGLLTGVQSQVDQLSSSITTSSQAHTEDLAARGAAAEDLSSKLDEIKTSVETLQGEASTLITTEQGQFEGAEKQRADSFTAAEAQREQKLTAAIEAAEKKVSDEIATEQGAHADLVTRQTEEGEAALVRLRALLEESETVVGAIGRTTGAGGFAEWEAAEGKAADTLRDRAIKYGVAAAASIAVMLALRLIFHRTAGLDVPVTLGTVALPGALGTIAAYSRAESSKHRRNQVLARRTEIAVKSFGPFIAKLPSDVQTELTAVMATVFFGQSATHATDEESDEQAGVAPGPLGGQMLLKMIDAASGAAKRSAERPTE